MTTSARKHRCGGTLSVQRVRIEDDSQTGMVLVYAVPGLICDACGEQFVEGGRVLEIESGQVPGTIWIRQPEPKSTLSVATFSLDRATGPSSRLALVHAAA
jgi:YgiT-type zinc finger domain-containing protein